MRDVELIKSACRHRVDSEHTPGIHSGEHRSAGLGSCGVLYFDGFSSS